MQQSLEDEIAAENAKFQKEIYHTRELDASSIDIKSTYLTDFHQLDIVSCESVLFFDLRHAGTEPVLLDFSLHELAPNLTSLTLKGKIRIDPCCYAGLELENLVLDGEVMETSPSAALELINLRTTYRAFAIGELKNPEFLDAVKIESVQFFTVFGKSDLADSHLLDFIQRTAIQQIRLAYVPMKSFPAIYAMKQDLVTLMFDSIPLERIPQPVINRINLYRLMGEDDDQFNVEFWRTKVPPCLDEMLEFGPQRKDEFKSMARLKHYITEHHEPEMFDELDSCTKFWNN